MIGRLGWLAAVLLLSGCAAQRAFDEGQLLIAEGKYLEGFAKVEQARDLDPSNAKYRIYLANTRLATIGGMVSRAESARLQGRLTEAEKLYKAVQGLDPRNPMVGSGLAAIDAQRRHQVLAAEAETNFKNDDLAEAEEQVRKILTEDPQHREALHLQRRIAERRTQEKSPEARLAAAFRKPITLEFREAALRSVFDMISKVSGINFFFDKDIRPDLKANITARNTSVEDAIRLLLITNQLEQKVLNENSLLIYPSTPQKLKDYQTLVVRSFYLANADAKHVAGTLKTLLKTRDIVVNEKLNLVIIRDTPEAVRMAEKLVALEDIGEAEAMLEVEVLEVKRSRLLDLGIRFPDQIALSLASPEGGSLTLKDLYNLDSSKVNVSMNSLVLNLKKEDSDSNILANPRIRVKNKEKAKILIGDRVPVITTTSTSTGFISDSVNYVDVGIKLEVEPHIYLDEEVAIKISLEVSSLVREVISRSGTLSYQIGTRNASTVLKLKDGETQVLAGLINDEERNSANRIPGLGDLPLFGRLFSSQKDDAQKTEIVLAITPRLIRTVRRPDLWMAEFETGTESSLGRSALSIATTTPEAEQKAAAPGRDAGAAQPAPGSAHEPAPAGRSGTASVVTPQPAAPGAAINPLPGTAPVAMPGAGMTLSWQAPSQVKVGDQFSAVLRLQSQHGLSGLPLLIAFDPTAVQVVSIMEGDFLKQAGGQSTFSSRVDPQTGQIFVGAVRQNGAINGTGTVLTVNFRAASASPNTKVQLLSANPEPQPPGGPVPLPVVHAFSISE